MNVKTSGGDEAMAVKTEKVVNLAWLGSARLASLVALRLRAAHKPDPALAALARELVQRAQKLEALQVATGELLVALDAVAGERLKTGNADLRKAFDRASEAFLE